MMVAALPAAAGGVVSISGDAIIFDAGSGDVNTIVVNGNGAAFDQSTGQFVTGITISDTTSLLSANGPCFVVTGTAICQVSTVSRAIIRTGNRDDVVSLTFNGDGPLLQMIVDGGLGDDTITGGPAADTLDGGAGNDRIDGGDGDDVINGGAGNDTINGGRNDDHLFGNAGTDIINGNGEADEIDGGIGDDIIDGGQGADVIRGDLGADRISGRDGFVDNINCGVGRDETNVDANDIVKRCE
ncbi:MAG TPA: hypothetical protein VEK79_22840 [Thermoanaerobaculia bacterium]|nr:hypothetical protein [Thermoanaerobaculia bacterium]